MRSRKFDRIISIVERAEGTGGQSNPMGPRTFGTISVIDAHEWLTLSYHQDHSGAGAGL